MCKISILSKMLAGLALLVGITACERDDAEPELETRKFSRLYVSFEENETSSGASAVNVRIVFPADSSVFEYGVNHVSEAKGGGVMYFNPYLKRLFQASANLNGVNDTVIRSMEVGTTGLLQNNGRLPNRIFSYVKGLAYQRASNVLFAVNVDGTSNSRIYVVDRPTRSAYVLPLKKYIVDSSRPFWGAAYENNRLFSSIQGTDGGIAVFSNVVTTQVNATDSTANMSYQTLTIDGSSNLRGLSYDTLKNVLAVTDYSGSGEAMAGRILIFEKFSDLIGTGNHTITPTRIIQGLATGLKQPMDVAIDTRETGVYMYVADRGAKKVFRFKYTDDGNVEPDMELQEAGATPVALALDTRDDSTLGQ